MGRIAFRFACNAGVRVTETFVLFAEIIVKNISDTQQALLRHAVGHGEQTQHSYFWGLGVHMGF